MLWVQNTFSTEQRLVQPPQQNVLLSTDTQEVMDVKNAKIFAGYARHVCWDYADLAIQAYPETVSFQSLSGMYVGLLSTFHKEDVFLLHATQRLVDRVSVLFGCHCAVNGRPKISSYESQKKRHEIPPELKSKTTKPGGSSVESVGGAKPLLLLSLQLVQLLDVRFLTPILESLSAAFRAAHGPSKYAVQHALAATTLRVLMHYFDLYRRDEAVEWHHALFSDGDFANLELAPEQVLRLEGLSKPRAKL
jgi:hypothetical protein